MLYLDKPLYHGKEEITRIVNIDGFVVQLFENDSLKSSIQEITEQRFRFIFDYTFFFFLRHKNVTPFVKISKRQDFQQVFSNFET